ncbi:MAG TPA: RHS repeat-associated core domain-containing protein [Candidatus Angelobacter sp.]|nr:RHS repeat-associated core domain-containing protein [Candidatus Angelobacter sp.]
MKAARLAVVMALVVIGSAPLIAQKAPDLENGFKNYGSYDGSHLDTVNLMNGNLMLHAPLLSGYPQRGSLSLQPLLTFNSKTWQVICANTSDNNGTTCGWFKGGTGVTLQRPMDVGIQRSILNSWTGTQLMVTAQGYSLSSADGSNHQLMPTVVTNGVYMELETIDTTGFHVVMSALDSNGVPTTATITDRHGNRYVAVFAPSGTCGKLPTNPPLPWAGASPNMGGGYAPMTDDTPTGDQFCPQMAGAPSITDSNGNVMQTYDPANSASAGSDTLGRPIPLGQFALTTDFSGCVSANGTNGAYLLSYSAPDGTTRQMKMCFTLILMQTAFNQYGVVEYPGGPSLPPGSNMLDPDNALPPISTIILADGTKWIFTYDNYGELSLINLPTGGSISYTWTTISQATGCGGQTAVSRAVATRTLVDGLGHSSLWTYTWGAAVNKVITNTVTDPLGNDTVHVFTAVDNLCAYYETSTKSYQGNKNAGHLLKQVDTTYYPVLPIITDSGENVAGNVVPKDITTTVFPSGKVSKIHREYDSGLGTGKPIFGNVKKELEYDWGQGAPGALLRETDTTYQWETNSAYLTAHLLDLPVSVIIKDAGSNRVAETDYAYDEPAYLTTPTPAISTQHVTPPTGVRGNQTTVSRWLNTTNSLIASHTKWYDTGEVYQTIDPLGHTTKHTYDPFYVGAYSTQTCSPTTNNVAHCVSGTYDFTTGVLTSLTNENATSQASGNTPGDAAHTSNYTYDFMFRITSAQAPPDPANNSLRATTSFNFSAPNAFPLSVQRSKSVTTALSDSATSFFDGLGRGYKSQHALPNGTATVDTTFDLAGHPATVSNPYFTASDPTYGTTTNAYDGLDRVTQTTKQDGSISRVAYSVLTSVAANGDCTVATDEAGKQRGACSDALGRLVEVDEPSGAAVQANYHALMQTDGNFVLLNSAGTPVWATGTAATNAVSMFMQDDGNLVTYIFKWQAGVYATPTPGSYPVSSCSIGTYLVAGEILPSGKCIVSPHGQYFLLMNTDGNFFIYDWAHATGTWGPGTQGHPGAYAIFQTDGNLVVYDVNGTALWSSGTSGTYAERMNLEDDGRIIIYKSAWNSGTSNGQFNGTTYAHPSCDVGIGTGTTGLLWSGQCFVSPNGRFELLLQTDGNLVIYDRSVTPNAQIWSTGTGFSTADPAVAYRTLYFYDALGNLTCVEQHGDAASGTGCSAAPSSDASSPWRVRRFTYDSFSRLLTAKNPESGTITYTYDADGQLLQKTSPAPNQTGTATQTVSYCYDELHRVIGKGYGAQSCPLATPVVSYAYDSGSNAKGKLTSLTDQAGTATYTYDILGRMNSETRTLTGANNGAISKTVSYEYNLDGSLYKLHYPSGAVVTYTPDSAGRTLSAVDSGNGINYVTGATYGPDSALTGFVSGNSGTFAGITNAFSYNKRLQPLNMSATAPSQTVFSIGYDFHLSNGDNGNVYGIINYKDTTHGRDQTFTYDALNRLISAQNAGTNCATMVLQNKTEYWGNSYSYDAWGNLLQKAITKCGAENLSVTADAHNWLHASGTDYQYDAAGNMTYDATASLGYTFDQENRLTGAAGYTYTYDGDGNRVRKSNGNLAANGTLYWYMTPGVVAESDLAGTLKSEYVFFDGERVARRDGATGTGGVFYYFSDHLKTASVITDSAGVIKAESDYYPWGGELQFVANDSNDYKFTGKKRDIETGLDYFGARYYSNGLGRWVSADWSATPVPVPYADLYDPQSLNLYGFVGGNPASKADPDGHCCTLGEVVDFVGGVSQGIVASASFGAVGAPKSSDSTASLWGQLAGTIIEGAVGTGLRTTGAGAVGVGLAAEAPSAGTSTAVVVTGAVGVVAGGAMETGAAKNVGGILNAMSSKNKESKGGEVYVTEPQASGKEYVGRTTQGTEKRMQTRTDGRTGKATKVDTYKTKGEGRYKEQKAIDQRGGKGNLDNKRNEVAPDKMKELEKKYGK